VPGLNLREFLCRARRRSSSILLGFVPIWLLRRLFPEPILCLCYHMVSDAAVPHVKHYKILSTAQFERDLDYLESRFEYLSYEQILESRRSQMKGSAGTEICLTFDDGFAECLSVVRPILLSRGATCIFFIITDLIDNRAAFFETRASLCVDAVLRYPVEEVEAIFYDLGLHSRIRVAEETYRDSVPRQMAQYWSQFEERVRPILVWLLMTKPDDAELVDRLCRRLHIDVESYVEKRRPYLSKEQILQLQSDGFTIGAHGCSHRSLQSLSVEQAEREIVQSCRTIRDLTGQASVPFAFPYFGGGLDRRWLAELRERHPFVGLYFDTQGQRPDAPIVVQRIFGERVNEPGSMGRLLRSAWLRRFS
jgi:peptidoglycan/xylan/chitin deacetylase (PgdA/CDA1 family)